MQFRLVAFFLFLVVAASAQTAFQQNNGAYSRVSVSDIQPVLPFPNNGAYNYNVTLSWTAKTTANNASAGWTFGGSGNSYGLNGANKTFTSAGTYFVANPTTTESGKGRYVTLTAQVNGATDVTVKIYLDQPLYKAYLSLDGGLTGGIFRIVQDGIILGQLTLAPGEKFIQQYTTSNNNPITVTRASGVFMSDGGGWAYTYDSNYATVTPSSGGSGSTVVPVAPPSSPPTAVYPTPTPDPNQPVPPAGEVGWKTTTDTTALNVDMYKQGVQAIVTAISSKGGGSSTDMTSTNSKLDVLHNDLVTANGHLDKIETAESRVKKMYDDGEAFNTSSTVSSMQSSGAGASSYTGVKPDGSIDVHAASAANPWDPYTVHVGNRDVTFGPESQGSVFTSAMGVLTGGRGLVVIGLILGFGAYCGRGIRQYAIGLLSARAVETNVGPENLVPAVSQGKTVASATALVAVTATALATMLAVVDGELGLGGSGISSMLTSVNLAAVGSALSWLESVYPLTLSAQLLVAGAAFDFLIVPIYFVATSTIKFIKA